MMILIWTLLLGYLVVFYLKEAFKRTRQKVPPGPWPLPVIGNLHQLAMANTPNRPDLVIAKMSEKYGEIYRLTLGLSETVFLSSYESIRGVLPRKEATGRDFSGSLYDRNKGKNSGILLGEGPKWEKIRPWTIKNLRDYGFHKTLTMESSILEDIKSMLDKTEESLGSDGKAILDIGGWLFVPVFKFIWKLLVGHYTLEDEEMLLEMIKKSNALAHGGAFGVGLVNAFPFVRFIIPDWTGHKLMMEFFDEGYIVAANLLKKSQSNKIETPQNFLEAFAKKITDDKSDDPDDCFNEHDFAVLFLDLFQAGSDTTASYMEALILYMVLFPEIQAKVYQEIQDNVPKDEPLAYSNSKSMIYTQAVMLEAHRHAKVVQNYIPRKALQDIEYKGYIIQKGTTIMTDLHTPYNCSKVWEKSEAFLPKRFISKEGTLINQNFVIPFSVGRRNCLAENLANVSSFLFFVSILQNFELSKLPGQPMPRMDMYVGFTSRPYPFQFVVSKRK